MSLGIRIGLGFVILGAFSAYMVRNREDLTVLQTVSFADLMLLLAATALFWLLTGLRFAVAMRLFNLRLRFRVWFGITVVTRLFSYLLPFRGGIVVKAVYLKHAHAFGYASFGVATSLVTALNIGINSMLLLGLLALTAPTRELAITGVIGIVLSLVILAVIIGALAAMGRMQWLRSQWRELMQSLGERAGRPGGLASLVLVQLGIRLVYALLFIGAFTASGVEAEPLDLAVLSVLVALSFLISLTPGNLGVAEGVVAACGLLFGYSPTDGAAVALLIRVLDLVLILALGIPYARVLLGPSWFRPTHAGG